MSWNEFVQKVLISGEVKNVTVNSQAPHKIKVNLHDNITSINGKKVHHIYVNVRKSTEVETMLREEEKKLHINPLEYIPVVISDVEFIPDDTMYQFSEVTAYTLLLLAGVMFILARMMKKQPPSSRLTKPSSPKKQTSNFFDMVFESETSTPETKTNVKFKDVAGMQEAKEEVMEFVHFLKNPAQYKRLGAKLPRGCLLTGPPGVGKTMLAKAVASEAGVPFYAKAGSDFVEMIGGLGARRIRQLFQKARDAAPSIIYIDELDALGAARSGGDKAFSSASREKDQTLNQMLVEMDGMLSTQHQVIVLASTNRADILDKALLRPGRFDRVVQIDLPNRQERLEILNHHLKCVKLKDKPENYSKQLANETPGMSGADLANICNEAAIYAARENDDVVDKKHLDYALERVLAGAPKSSTSISPEERKIVAVHESGHALMGWLLEHTEIVSRVSIIPRSKAMLGFSKTLSSDGYLYSEEQLFDRMCMTLGGRAAESLIYGRITHGAEDDLNKVTDLAYAQIKQFGFNPNIGPISYPKEGDFQLRPYSEALATTIDVEVRNLIKKAYDRTLKTLQDNKNLLEKLSSELLKRETLNYDDIELVIGPPIFKSKKQFSYEDGTTFKA
ncbi:mitochondrial inner membrane m-AAA protease component paraplegin-like isoform X2 [Clavelina lepadiformis]